MAELSIRMATEADAAALWRIMEPTFRAGETYTVPRDIASGDALAYWFSAAHRVFVVDGTDGPIGTYILRDNQPGGGDHVCNAAFLTAAEAEGRGAARAMLTHALDTARDAGYRAMQFNFVVATNTRAVVTWERAGFEIVGRLPGAFRHPNEGFVDALVMYRTL
ncbi:Acetyltransferase (GNAT) family protein [Roseivivax jejudonensis]|uniref:Acetyltransferase (GNAT) family protein n=1 Tax=Roseivivax jejudonensis TaxID=1529041 RepID=A0A1X6YIB8_9RHOB|nr:GNAT family N-acetyltransferase [Roseivivax jejudonensis]SLN20490.1 Acetyltransferase (GNAT) family protein [Roseivivax jejudonensis]